MEVKEEIRQESNLPEEKKKNKIAIIISVILVLVIAVLGGIFVYQKLDSRGNNSNNEPPTKQENKEDDKSKNTKVEVKNLKTDGDFKINELIIPSDLIAYNKSYDFKLDNHLITLKTDDFGGFDIYVDNNYIYSDTLPGDMDWDFYKELDEKCIECVKVGEECEAYPGCKAILEEKDKGFSLNFYSYGNYLVMENTGYTYIRSQHVYIIGEDGKLLREIYTIIDSGMYISSIRDENINKNGFKLEASRYDRGPGTVSIGEEEYSYCDLLELPDNVIKNTVIDATFEFKYENGKLDTNGKMIDSVPLTEYIEAVRKDLDDPDACNG